MQLNTSFLPHALKRLATEPLLAGVAGFLEDASIANTFDRSRVSKGAVSTPHRSAKWLNDSGLYRRSAIAEAGGYAVDSNLEAWEEAELGMRLTARGWSLERIDFPSTLHAGHAASTWQVLRSIWRCRRAMANGVLLKQAVGRPWMLKALPVLLHPLLVILMWVGAVMTLAIGMTSGRREWAPGYWAVLAGCVVLLAMHKKGLNQALVSLGTWHYFAALLLLGLRENTKSPTEAIDGIDLSLPGAG